jgi:hypothetical protein
MSESQPARTARPGPPADPLIVWGAEAIGRVIGRNPRQAFYLLEKGALPARKVRGIWCANVEKLIAHCSGDDQVERV